MFQNETKFEALRELLLRHPNEKVLIFSESNSAVYSCSKRFLIPFITHETKGKEREEILEAFKEGDIRILIAGRVLDEGFDCGDVSIGIMMSGSSVERQYVQRLGRLLRTADGKDQAILYELITPATFETRHGSRRRKGVS